MDDNVRRMGSFISKSARASRRGSRAGLAMTSALSTATSTAAVSDSGDYFPSGIKGPLGPDFVNGQEEDEEDEEQVTNPTSLVEAEEQEERADDVEVANLARQGSSFGLGGLVDRVVGMSLFDSEKGRREEEEEEMRILEKDRLKRVRDSQRELKDLVMKERKAAAEKKEDAVDKIEEEGSGWTDAAWLLSVASRVIF